MVSVFAQDEPEKIDYPKLVASGKSLNAFVPKGWKIIAQATGDLNKDQQPDIAVVLQCADTAYIVRNQSFGVDSLNTAPRILAVLFRNKQNNGYALAVQSNHFIPRHDHPTMDEPFAGIGIDKNGVLSIDTHFWYSMGSWSTSEHTHKFRFQNNRFELIGYDAHHLHRGSGETTEYSINFSTKKMRTKQGSIEKNEPDSVKTTSFKLAQLKTLSESTASFAWEFQGLLI
jgi:hypothetical protein